MERTLPLRRSFQKWDDVLWIAGALVVMACAFLLAPSEVGYGTHEKLFLPPCYFRLLTQVNCPLCGLTTSVCHLARGEWLAALRANVLGPLVSLFVLAQLPFRASRLLGRPPAMPRWWYQPWLLWAALGFAALCWPVNIYLQFSGR